MTTDELRELIASDEVAKKLADAGNDSGCAERCREIAPPTLVETLLGELGIIKLYPDPAKSETVLQQIEAIAEGSQDAPGNPVVKRVLKWMQPGAPGVDFGDVRVRTMLTLPIQSGGLGLTDEQAAPLLRSAERPAAITANDVSVALRGPKE